MSLLTEQEIEKLRDTLHIAIAVEDFQAIESAVIEKIKAQGVVYFAQYQGRNIEEITEEQFALVPETDRFKLYRLPEGD